MLTQRTEPTDPQNVAEYFGYRVVKLVRVRIMNIKIGDLPVGKYRDLTHQEWEGLLAAIREWERGIEWKFRKK